MSSSISGQLTVLDVFLLDSDFKIERPTRYYRQGLHLLTDGGIADKKKGDNGKGKGADRSAPRQRGENNADNVHHAPPGKADRISILGSIRSKISKLFKQKSDAASIASTTSSHSERPQTPVLDPSTNANPLLDADEAQGHPHHSKKNRYDPSKLTFYIENSQMKLKLAAKHERQMLQWTTALERAAATCHFTRRSRFDSFAPVRLNVAAQWLVDGVRDFQMPSRLGTYTYYLHQRDYFWNLSRAILLAKESIYIHGWWLSPGKISLLVPRSFPDMRGPILELQLRRPGKERYRLDRLLQRKARAGVKIYVIL